MTAQAQTIDATVLDLIADPAILRELSRIVAAERKIRDLYATAKPYSDELNGTFPTMMDAAAALAAPQGARAYNEAQSARRVGVFHTRDAQNEAFESLRLRVTLVAENLVRAEVAA